MHNPHRSDLSQKVRESVKVTNLPMTKVMVEKFVEVRADPDREEHQCVVTPPMLLRHPAESLGMSGARKIPAVRAPPVAAYVCPPQGNEA
jgi:hypothetical protein